MEHHGFLHGTSKKLVDKVLEMDTKKNGSFGKCLVSFSVSLLLRNGYDFLLEWLTFLSVMSS
jgi:hypothetical protein